MKEPPLITANPNNVFRLPSPGKVAEIELPVPFNDNLAPEPFELE